MRPIFIAVAILLAGCGDPPAPVPPDPTKEPAYIQAVAQLVAINREAAGDIRTGKPDDASALILKGEPITTQILGVPRPTLEAMEAASDLDELYGRMLLSNRNYGWARLQFQKNLARWKYWKPQTPETGRRLEQARTGIDECDRRIIHQ